MEPSGGEKGWVDCTEAVQGLVPQPAMPSTAYMGYVLTDLHTPHRAEIKQMTVNKRTHSQYKIYFLKILIKKTVYLLFFLTGNCLSPEGGQNTLGKSNDQGLFVTLITISGLNYSYIKSISMYTFTY